MILNQLLGALLFCDFLATFRLSTLSEMKPNV
nr:MAG TPA: hypothetical protein [Herelleviridae sp.]